MIFTENLDHNPQAVTLEKLPDGTAWLYLRKDAHEVHTEAPEGEQGGTSWECTTALCKLGADYAEETVESITAVADDWWVYAEAWPSFYILQNDPPRSFPGGLFCEKNLHIKYSVT